jgi:hypothetical protein
MVLDWGAVWSFAECVASTLWLLDLPLPNNRSRREQEG